MLFIPQAAANRFLRLNIIKFDGYGWQVQGAKIALDWQTHDTADLQLSVAQLHLPSPLDQTIRLSVTCPGATLSPTAIRCQNGSVQLDAPFFDPAPMKISFRYAHPSQALQLSLSQTPSSGGRLAITGQFQQSAWQLSFDATALEVSQLASRLAQFSIATLAPLAGLLGQGTLSLHARVAGREMQVEIAELHGSLQDMHFSDSEALHVGEHVSSSFSLTAKPLADSWQLRAELAAQHGQVYIDPIFLDFSAQPISLVTDAHWRPNKQSLKLAYFRFEQTDIVRTEGQLTLDLTSSPALTACNLRLPDTPLQGLYQTYVQPFLIGTPLDALETSGRVSFDVDCPSTETAKVQVRLDDVHINDQKERYAIHGVHGNAVWTDAQSPPRLSQLSWQAGQVYELTFGASTLELEAHGQHLRLLNQARIPVLDGAVQFDLFRLGVSDDLKPRWQFAGRLEPISMEAFSRAMNWHPLAGTLAGVIPQVTYADQLVEIDGNLQVDIFDGTVTVRNLRLERLLSVVPQLSADIDIENFDLKRLTETFSFGKIWGKLSGHIHNLVLQDWQPIFFDASFATPEDDSSAHRISQRAIDNLSSLGGVQGALSRSFLSFFENFSYSRLGFSCRLRLDVCHMDGVESADQGYYLVKGGGLPPHINVIGHTREVVWKELLERLQRATSGAAPQIGP